MKKFPTIEQFKKMLGQAASSEEIACLIKLAKKKIDYHDHVGAVSVEEDGYALIFKEKDNRSKSKSKSDFLLLQAVHFFSHGYEGHEQYKGALLGGVVFGDKGQDVKKKLGKSECSGGGGYSTLLQKKIPHWVRYRIDRELFQLQFDDDGKVDLATLYLDKLDLK